MKTVSQALVSTLWCLTVSQASVIEFTAERRAANHPNLHSQYTDLLNGNVVNLLVEGYSGEVNHQTINTTFTPKHHFTNAKDLAIRDVDLEGRSDVCLRVTDCAGYLTDSAAYYAAQGWSGLTSFCGSTGGAVSNYFTANNYEHAKAVLDGSLSSLAILVPVTAATYYLNMRFDTLSGSSTQDACGETQPTVMAENAASSMYEFCVGIQTSKMEDSTTRFNAGDSTSSDDTFNSGDGIQGLSKFNIGSVEFDTLAVCQDYGISWRRHLASALERGARQSARRAEWVG